LSLLKRARRIEDPPCGRTWTRLPCHRFAANAVRLQLRALAYNLANFLRSLALPDEVKHWSMTTLRDRLVKIGAKIVHHGRSITFQMAEVMAPRALFAEILTRIAQLRVPPAPALPANCPGSHRSPRENSALLAPFGCPFGCRARQQAPTGLRFKELARQNR
jgi:hypothetical protein